MKPRLIVIVLLLCAVFLPLTEGPFLPTAPPMVYGVGTLVLNPSAGLPQTQVVMSGNGFTPDADCWPDLSTVGPMIPLQNATGLCSVDASGNLIGFFFVRSDAITGWYGVSLQSAYTPFQVTSTTTTTTTTITTTVTSSTTTTTTGTTTIAPFILISPNYASVGSSTPISVTGGNFVGSSCWFASNPLIGSSSCTLIAGALSATTFTPNPSATVGQYTVTVQSSGGSSASYPFIITPSTTVTSTSTSTTTTTTTATSSTTSTSTSVVYSTTTSGTRTINTTTSVSTVTVGSTTTTLPTTTILTTISGTATSILTSTLTSFSTILQQTVVTTTSTESATDQAWIQIYAIIAVIGLGCVCLLVILLKLLGRSKTPPPRYTPAPDEALKPIVE